MDARLKVGEEAREHLSRLLPRQPEIVGGKGHEHGAHAKIDPALGPEKAHGGVDKRKAGLAVFEGIEEAWIAGIGAQAFVDAGHGFVFNLRFCFEFLHEVTVPVETADEGFIGAWPCAALRSGERCDLCLLFERGMINLTHRQASEGDVSGKAGACGLAADRARHGALVGSAALVQEAVKR